MRTSRGDIITEFCCNDFMTMQYRYIPLFVPLIMDKSISIYILKHSRIIDNLNQSLYLNINILQKNTMFKAWRQYKTSVWFSLCIFQTFDQSN